MPTPFVVVAHILPPPEAGQLVWQSPEIQRLVKLPKVAKKLVLVACVVVLLVIRSKIWAPVKVLAVYVFGNVVDECAHQSAEVVAKAKPWFSVSQ